MNAVLSNGTKRFQASGKFGGGAGESRVLFVCWCAEIGVSEAEDWVESFCFEGEIEIESGSGCSG
jgi:hypothetical protein